MTFELIITPLQLPDALDSADATDFLEASAAIDKVKLEIWGNRDRISTPEARLTNWRDNEYSQNQMFLGRVDGKLAGYASVHFSLKDNLNTAYVYAAVLPEHRRRGFGRQLLAKAEQFAAENGRTVVQSNTEHPAGFPFEGALVPKSGSGALPADSAGVLFAQRYGFELEMVERFSELSVPVSAERLAEFRVASQAKAGSDYQIVYWHDRVPEEIAEELAKALTQMTIDMPSAGLEFEVERWDVARLRKSEKDGLASGQQSFGLAAMHVPTGEVAAYTYIHYDAKNPEILSQEDTFVFGNHRGKRLGLLVKAVMLEYLAEELPQTRKVITWNAAENDYMLAINIDLGFTPAGYDGEWQKVLS